MHDDEIHGLDDDEIESADASAVPAPVEHRVETKVELSAMQARVLGCLIEKSYLTPDVYPMTTNSLVTACNQKTSRDPVVAYTSTEIDGVLMEMRQIKLVRRVHTQGARSTKHRHALDEVLPLSPQQIVLLSVLLLRGDQTANELRTRTERHDVFDSPTAVYECLESLADRQPALVVELARQSGHKDTRWRHLLGDGVEPAPPGAQEPMSTAPPHAAPVSALDSDASPADTVLPNTALPNTVLPERAEPLTGRVERLEAEVAALRAQLQDLAASLGEELS